jgi:hypothetical protein
MHPVHLRMHLHCLLALHVHAMYLFAVHGRMHAMFRVHMLEVHGAYVHVPYNLHGVQSFADVWTDGGRAADIAIASDGFTEIEGAIAARAEAG